jgi:hypothetical protein
VSEPNPHAGFSYSLVNGRLGTLRGVTVAEGTIAVPGAESVPPASREVTPRAVDMTGGIFEFAERSHAKDPSEPGKGPG